MKMTITKTISYIAASALLGLGTVQASVSTGDAAPDFTLTDTYGNEHSLSDFVGQVVILEWLNHGCPFVVRHYASGLIPRLQKQYTEDGTIWLSIVSSAPGKQGYYENEEANEITEKYGAVPTAVLVDSSGDVGRLYGARTTPQMFIINEEGVLVYQGAFDNDAPGSMKEDERTNYVVTTMTALADGDEVEVHTTRPYGCSVKY
jgi:hypothetical protein